ncbi:MAG: carbohydrate binding family 9 domain-containing protein [Candidatus Hydrothermales bacterium]
MIKAIYLLTLIQLKEEVILKKLTPKVDGIVSYEEWAKEAALYNFFEIQPEEGKIPPFKTEAYTGYDNENLYFAFKCYDDIKTIRKTLTKRDEVVMNDMLVIYLDTYGKEKEGYIFGTNPLGVQFDGIKGPPPQMNEDWSFDTYFEVKSFISDSFWSCEFKIPFSSLRFENKDKQEWNLILIRIRPRETFTIYSFPLVSKNIPSFFGQGAKIIIPEKIYSKEKKNDFIPYLIGSQSGIRKINYENDRGKFNLGLSGKARFLQNLVLDYALNPDFAQIETDIPQIDVNTTYALYYPEKRPLFMEGSEFIKMPINLFYTRMVNNPLYALKLTGKVSIFDLYFLSSYDENTFYLLPFEDASFDFCSNKKSFINLLRIRSEFLNKESHIGIFIGDREVKNDDFDNGFNRIFGFDAKLRFLKHYTISYHGGYSITKEPEDASLFSGIGIIFKDYTDRFDGEKFLGYANRLVFSSSFKNLHFSLYYDEYSPTFRSDIGFINGNNIRERGFNISPIFYPNRFYLTEISFWTRYEKETNFEKIFKEEEIEAGFNTKFSFAQLELGFEYSRENENVFNIYFLDYSRFNNIYFSSFWLKGMPYKFLLFHLYYGEGKDIFYQVDTLVYQNVFSSNISFLYTKLIISLGLEKQNFYFKRYKEKITEASVFYSSLNYSFTQKISLRFTMSYYKGSIGIYPLFTYQVNPFTFFYLGANVNAFKYGDLFKGKKPFKLEGEDHQIFLKLQYVFKI